MSSNDTRTYERQDGTSPGSPRRVGAEATIRRKRGPGWLPWLLALLLIGLIALTVWALTSDGDDDSVDGAAAPAAGADSGTATGGDDDGGVDDTGRVGPIVAGDQDVLSLAGDGESALSGIAGQSAVGTDVEVQSVVADEAFWVGSGEQDRVLVFIADAGAESGENIDVGERVTFRGTVQPLADGFAEQVGIESEEGADQLAAQGHYIVAEETEVIS